MWLGSERGYLSDWVTQRWVQATGRRIDFSKETWLQGPVGSTSGIGERFVDDLSAERGWVIRSGSNLGLVRDFSKFRSKSFHPERVDSRVIMFYERTGSYEMDDGRNGMGFFARSGVSWRQYLAEGFNNLMCRCRASIRAEELPTRLLSSSILKLRTVRQTVR